MNFFSRIRKNSSAFVICMTCISMSACQKPLPNEIHTDQQRKEETQVIAPDLNLICKKLKKEMQEMSAQRTTFALQQINQDIRLCLPLMKYDEQMELMALANYMYAKFLEIDRTTEQQNAFTAYAHDQSQFPTIQQSHLEQLHIRDQYLLRHKGQAYIDLVDTIHGESSYKRNSQYLGKVFAPYFPEAEKQFMQTLATQNQMPIFKKNMLLIAPQEISLRAQYWENYLKAYPESRYRSDAQYLLQLYSSLLFIGLEDSPVSIHFENQADIQVTSLVEIERLSKNKNSRLADQARMFLKFLAMNNQQRNNHLATESTTNTTSSEQLKKYLNLKTFDFSKPQPRDCFSDAICYNNQP